ncbi:MAG: hypothetical protein FJ276_32860 [Planctomycetes bacterium]|nr:hypothetical protein [Planctomycetota bacterium]
MPTLEYFLVCESMSVDRETNRVSLFNIIEEMKLRSPNDPGPMILQMYAVACLIKTPGDDRRDLQAVFRIAMPDGTKQDIPMNFQMERPRVRLVLRFCLAPADNEVGDVAFIFLVNGEEFAHHAILVHPAESDG